MKSFNAKEEYNNLLKYLYLSNFKIYTIPRHFKIATMKGLFSWVPLVFSISLELWLFNKYTCTVSYSKEYNSK